MLPIIAKIGPITLHSYGLMVAVSFIICVHFIRRDTAAKGIDPDIAWDATFWTLIVGLAGTRILYIWMFPEEFSWTRPWEWIAIWNGGLVFQGAFVILPVFLFLYLKKRKVAFWMGMDIGAPYMALGHGIGRIGCFLNGCCYGKRTEMPWGISFPRIPWDLSEPAQGGQAFMDHCARYGLSSSTAQWSYPVHPTQLYSVVALLTIFALLYLLRSRFTPFHGFYLCMYGILYSAFRFTNEFFRGDHNPTSLLPYLTDQQIFSIVAFSAVLAVMFVLFLLSRKSRGAPNTSSA